MDGILPNIVTLVKELQSLKAESPSSITFFGNVIFLREVQPLKAELPISFTDEGIDTVFNLRQYLKCNRFF